MLRPCWGRERPWKVLDVGWERLSKLVDRQSNLRLPRSNDLYS
jgi:hypothetical protein